MKYFIRNIIILIVTIEVLAYSQNTAESQKDSARVKLYDTLRIISHSAFDIGERLIYDVNYSFITAGEATFTISPGDSIYGRECLMIVFTVKSTPTFSLFYKVDDRYELLLDKKGVFPWRSSQKLHEGKYRHNTSTEFDQLNNIATTEKGTYKVPPYVYDVLSALYYVRTMDLSGFRPGERFYLKNFFKDSTYNIGVKFLGYQRVSVTAGTFDCVVIEPLIQEGGLFKSEGRILIWMTNDERKIPVKVSTKIVIGSIDGELREYTVANGTIRAKIN